jgi:hypothetical protein
MADFSKSQIIKDRPTAARARSRVNEEGRPPARTSPTSDRVRHFVNCDPQNTRAELGPGAKVYSSSQFINALIG